MTAPTVTTTELTGYRATAAELRRIADALLTLPDREDPPFVTFSILPAGAASKTTDDEKVSTVDAVALAVMGRPGTNEKIGADWYRIARSSGTGNLYLTVQASVSGPPDARDVELASLRAEVEALRSITAADATGLGYSRTDDHPDDPTPISPARVPLHTGAMVDGDQLVDETDDGCPRDPQTGQVRHLLECAEDREMRELSAWPASTPPASPVLNGSELVDEGGDW